MWTRTTHSTSWRRGRKQISWRFRDSSSRNVLKKPSLHPVNNMALVAENQLTFLRRCEIKTGGGREIRGVRSSSGYLLCRGGN